MRFLAIVTVPCLLQNYAIWCRLRNVRTPLSEKPVMALAGMSIPSTKVAFVIARSDSDDAIQSLFPLPWIASLRSQ
jgi:hypothetical protein